MQTSIAVLARTAISAALKSNWREALAINLQILEKDPDNLDAKVRLGRCYIQTKNFDKAKKLFKEILKKDPINQIAIKNLELANKGKVINKDYTVVDPTSLLKEPGTTTEVSVAITAKRVTGSDFFAGEVFHLKIKKRSADVFQVKKDEDLLIGNIDNADLLKKLNAVLTQGGNLTASFVRGKDTKNIVLLIKSTIPVFKAEKQDVRPYIKKGSFEEPELEMEQEIELEE